MANKVFKYKTGDLFKIDPDEIVIPDTGALADERANLPVKEDLVLDIMVRGVILAVVVSKGPNGEPVLVDGRQRVKAAREANSRLKAQGSPARVLVPAVYRVGDDLGLYAAMVSANEHRKEDDPLDKAKKLERFYALGGTETEAAIMFGVSRQTICNWAKMLNASPELKAAVKAGEVSATAASELAALPKDKQSPTLDALKQDGRRPTVQRARKVAMGKPDKPRLKNRREIEFVHEHRIVELEKLSGLAVVEWVLGIRDLDQFNR